MKTIKILLFVVFAASAHAITIRDLYESSGPGSVTLTPADDESARIQLQSPVHFCTEKFDEVFVSIFGKKNPQIFRIFQRFSIFSSNRT